MKTIQKGVTFPRGFLASGVEAYIKRQVRDLAVVYSEYPCQAAGVFTTNKVQASCVAYNRRVIENGPIRALVVNSGNANACNGTQGEEDTLQMARLVARELSIPPGEVLVASTGVIGVNLPMEKISKGIKLACGMLSTDGGEDAAQAIMTTDTFPKLAGLEFEIGGRIIRIGAMAKGSGMIHPNMATMLAFITTDAAITRECLQQALRDSADISFNMISVDGDTSTNDMAVIMANGQAHNDIIDNPDSESYSLFKQALDRVNITLAKMIARDGEGATRLIEVEVSGAKSDRDARITARAIVSSNLFKAAVYGQDANWGRIICAAGYSGADLNPDMIDIWLGRQQVARNGSGLPFDEDLAREDLAQEVVKVKLVLKQGAGQATAWGCDLTYDYVKINASYRS
ncbi:MAG: bifunctional glutamate N-acetyltransferase/amino-acid acetyltransferase ArgJ [Bacillota bacterium]